MTREQLHTAIALMREAARVVGEDRSVHLHVHACDEGDLALAEEAGGRRWSFESDGRPVECVELEFGAHPAPTVCFYLRAPKATP